MSKQQPAEPAPQPGANAALVAEAEVWCRKMDAPSMPLLTKETIYDAMWRLLPQLAAALKTTEADNFTLEDEKVTLELRLKASEESVAGCAKQ